MNQKDKMSMTCKIDLAQLTHSIKGFNQTGEGLPMLDDSEEKPKSVVDLFGEEVHALRGKTARISDLIVSLIEKLKLPESHQHLLIGGKAVGEKVDETTTDLPSYHNQHHIAEVVASSYILGKRERLPHIRIAELIVAAAAHDLGHTGGSNSKPYELETLSCEIAIPILTSCGWSLEEVTRIWQMVVATDFINGVPSIRQTYLDTKTLPTDNENRLLSIQCLLLTEADILFSCFNSEYNEELSRLLSQEWNLPSANLTIKQRIDFLNRVTFISDAAKQLGIEERRLDLIASLQKQLPPES